MIKTSGQLIVEYALQSEDNLQIALAIMYGCFDDIKRKIIDDFLNAREEGLKRSFPPPVWLVENSFKQAVLAIYSGLYLRKEVWGDPPYWIGFEAQQSQAKWFIVGVMKDEPSSQSIGSLKARMDEQYGKGKADEWWEWYQEIGDGDGDWDNETTLLRLYRREEAVQYFLSHLARIGEIVSSWMQQRDI